jgi:hypothetical protein
MGKRERDHLEDLSIDGRIILDYNLKRKGVRMRIGFNWLWIESCDAIL